MVIVTYQSARHLPRLLADLAAASAQLALHVLVVDNASTDGTAQIAEEAGVTVIPTGANLGYAGALNVAFRHVGPEDPVLVLNPDVSLEAGAIEALLAAVEADGVGVAVPTIRDMAGTVAPSMRSEPSIVRAFTAALLGRRTAWLPAALSEIVWTPSAYDRQQYPDWACGAALLMTAECLRLVGDWDDERFFLYSEETDFFRRVRMAGLRTVFVPQAQVRHVGGGSGSSPALVALMAVNRVRYFEKYHSGAASLAFRAAVVLHELLRCRDAGHRAALRALVPGALVSSAPVPGRGRSA